MCIRDSFVSWNKIFNIQPNLVDANTMTKAVQILLAAIILQFVLRLVTSILYALQEAFVDVYKRQPIIRRE